VSNSIESYVAGCLQYACMRHLTFYARFEESSKNFRDPAVSIGERQPPVGRRSHGSEAIRFGAGAWPLAFARKLTSATVSK
jgi:hypothetical protein